MLPHISEYEPTLLKSHIQLPMAKTTVTSMAMNSPRPQEALPQLLHNPIPISFAAPDPLGMCMSPSLSIPQNASLMTTEALLTEALHFIRCQLAVYVQLGL